MIVVASDHAGYPLKEEIKTHLDEKGIKYIDAGCYSPERYDYAKSAQKACDMVVSGEAEKAILVCGTGIGISMAANKVKGIRAAVVSNEFGAEMTRRHNNANVLCMGGRVINEEDAVKFADIFLNTPFSSDEERHTRRVQMLCDIDSGTFSAE